MRVFQRPYRQRIQHSIFFVGVIAVVLLFVACPTPSSFEEDYAGVNLIAARGFGATDDDGTEAWRRRDAADGYLVWEPAEATAYPTDGIPPAVSDGPVYRLEMKNIFANGDFEDVPVGEVPVGWNSAGPTATNARVITAAAFNSDDRANGVDLAPLHGDQVLLLNYESPEERFFLDLTDPRGGLTVPVDQFERDLNAGMSLAFFLDFRTRLSSVSISLNDGPNLATDVQDQIEIFRGSLENDQTEQTQLSADQITFRYPGQDRAPEESAQSAPDRNHFTVTDVDVNFSQFSIGGFTSISETRADAVIDNLRLTRSDLNHAVYLEVPFIDPLDPGRPKIVGGGTYSFSFWIAQDTTAGSANRFVPRYMRVTLIYPGSPEAPASTASKEIFLEDRSEVTAWGTSWSPIEIVFSGPASFSSDPSPTAFELEIALGGSGDSAKQYPGSLMIAAPELYYSPN